MSLSLKRKTQKFLWEKGIDTIKQPLKGLILTINWPYLPIYYAICRSYDNSSTRGDWQEGRRRNERKPRGNLKAKRRNLSPAPGESVHKEASPQPECRLLQLPKELREMIWMECVGGRTLHVTSPYFDSLWTNRDPEALHLTHSSCHKSRCNDTQCDGEPPDGTLISLPSTCHQIYAETIPLIYKSNDFSMSNPFFIEFRPALFLQSRWSMIRDLRFTWQVMGYPPAIPLAKVPFKNRFTWNDVKGARSWSKRWVTVWEQLALMNGLRNLDVTLFIFEDFEDEWIRLDDQLCDYVLRPIGAINAPKSFDLRISVKALADQERWKSCKDEKYERSSRGGEGDGVKDPLYGLWNI